MNSEKKSLYYAWYHMIRRCSDPLDPAFMRYGGRNITVCMRWRKSFHAFAEDVGERPSPRHSIDRIDNNGNYEPGNVRWATRKEQQRNRKGNHLVNANGITRSVAEWSEALGVSWATVAERLKHGWSPERAVTQARQKDLSFGSAMKLSVLQITALGKSWKGKKRRPMTEEEKQLLREKSTAFWNSPAATDLKRKAGERLKALRT